MSTTIAISGKGGSGKTTLAAMIIRSLLGRPDSRAVLAVDADPNSCLGLTLGVEPAGTVADIREDARAQPPAGVDRLRSVEYAIQQAITEAAGFDLLTMGRPEGPDCYCAVNNMLRKFLDELSSQYQFVIMDNEAGMEHLSRRTTNNVDFLCIVAEPTPLGTITAKRIFDLAEQLPISVKKIGVIWNETRAPFREIPATSIKHRTSSIEIETFGWIPYDKSIFDASMQGKTIFDFAEDSPAFLAVRKILENKLNPKDDKSISSTKRDTGY
jgi:CO dehydrogenase maturation factor